MASNHKEFIRYVCAFCKKPLFIGHWAPSNHRLVPNKYDYSLSEKISDELYTKHAEDKIDAHATVCEELRKLTLQSPKNVLIEGIESVFVRLV